MAKRKIEEVKNVDLLIDMCLKKLDGINDYSWEDLVKLFNLSYSPCHLRKMSYGFLIYRDYLEMSKDFSNNTTLDKYKSIIGSMEHKRTQMRTQRRELNKLKKDFNNALEVSEELIDYFEENGLEILVDNYSCEPLNKGNNKMVVTLSDLHIGALINCNENKYNLKIAQERLKKYYCDIVKMIKLYDINTVYLMCLGDNCENYLMRQTQALECEFSLAQQIAECQKIIFEFALNLSKVSNVKIGMVRGNHSRICENKNNDIYKNSVDVVINENIKYMVDLINSDRIEVLPTDYNTIDLNINGKLFRFLHGDQGAKDSRKLLKNISGVNPEVDVVVRGHYHSAECVQDNNGRRCITVGTVQGYNNYSINFGASALASQTVIVVGDEDIECIRDIILQ